MYKTSYKSFKLAELSKLLEAGPRCGSTGVSPWTIIWDRQTGTCLSYISTPWSIHCWSTVAVKVVNQKIVYCSVMRFWNGFLNISLTGQKYGLELIMSQFVWRFLRRYENFSWFQSNFWMFLTVQVGHIVKNTTHIFTQTAISTT